ncbi:hypothetical protein [Streptomyces cylindrosporus]|uniref:Uncharacterized protein n=1 Tax=Streptomyces cylindrosporus TaxID=2927583 RepID=A0ABS9YJX8_9ACTN|nr:hypothetical protein [Streptomyces cylindrosporus]MCI3277562.1 hypothetical protein [Streptomyces cylindrosporus]
MNIVRDLYLGWTDINHGQDCPLPVWEPQLCVDQGLRGRLLVQDQVHGCQAEECDHANVFSRFTIRLVCRSCTTVHLIHGEEVAMTTTTTPAYGYGQAARELEGLWLWPGERLAAGRVEAPREYLVTRTPNIPTRAADVAGTISQYPNSQYRKRWQASAISDPTGPYGDDQLRWARRRNELDTVDEAAAWISAQYQPQIVEVAV